MISTIIFGVLVLMFTVGLTLLTFTLGVFHAGGGQGDENEMFGQIFLGWLLVLTSLYWLGVLPL